MFSLLLIFLATEFGVSGAYIFIGVLTLLVMPWLQRRAWLTTLEMPRASHSLVQWTLVAWLVGLIVAVPLYTPYPRLALPLVCIAALTAAPYFAARSSCAAQPIQSRDYAIAGVFVVAFAVLASTTVARKGPEEWLPEVAWQDRRGLESIATPLVDAATASFAANPTGGHGAAKAALYVFAEPALFYHLSALPKRTDFRYLTQPIGDHALLTEGVPDRQLATFILTGPHAEANPADADRFAAALADGTLTLVQSFPYTPSDLVLLDQVRPRDLDDARRQEVRLYRVRP